MRSVLRYLKTRSFLQVVVICLVFIICYQAVEINNKKVFESKSLHHNGLPWMDEEILDNRKRSPQLSDPEHDTSKNRTLQLQHRRPSNRSKINFVRNVNKGKRRPHCFKQVQIWSTEYTFWKQGEFPCPGLPCGIRQYTSTSLKTLQTSDAVLMWHETLWDWDELHKHRPPGQKWILTTSESPINTRRSVIPPPKYANSSYNYIMTYHPHESDFYGAFGRYDSTVPAVRERRNWAAGKTRMVAWASRNCNNTYVKWKRWEFVKTLSEMVSVDMYGICGDKICERNEKACDDILRNHKFYLSLENCNCRHYITEKFWKMALSYDLVPVVYGPPRADYEKVAPPNSFIHVEDFNSIKELADYLDLLDMNDDKYNQYFAWKTQGSTYATPPDWLYQPQQMCQVVERLLEEETKPADSKDRPSNMDWNKWWFGSCKDIGRFPIIMN